MTSLFRNEAIEHSRQRLYGDVVVTHPVSNTVLVAGIVAVSVAAILFVSFATYSRTERVQGFIAPSGGLLQVYANRGGIVKEVLVREGDRVPRGAPLIALSLDTTTAKGPTAERVRSEAEARRDRIFDQVQSVSVFYETETERLQVREKSIRQDLKILERRVEAAKSLLTLQERDAARYGELANSGAGSLIELSRRQQQVFAQKGALYDLERQVSGRESDLGDVGLQLRNLPSQRDEKLSQLQGNLAESTQRLAELDLAEGYVLTAPQDGVVAGLQVSVGTSLTSATPALALMPDGSDLEAQLLVPTRSAGLLKVGQDVRIRVDAFPYQRFGLAYGRIQQISTASYRPGELLAPIAYQEPVYRIVVELEQHSISAYGEERVFVSGMTLNADVVIENVSFIGRLLDPLRAAIRR